MKKVSEFNRVLLFLFVALIAIPQAEVMGKKIPLGISVVLDGDYPDPSIVKDGDDYYMTTTPMGSPNLVIWHSRDLMQWERIASALNADPGGSVWAVDFVKYGNLFYIYYPVPSRDGGIYVITAENPAGHWSEPVEVKGVKGIDPGHVAGRDGRRFLYVDKGRMVELAPNGLSVTGPEVKVYDGWKFDDSYGVECFCLESPKSLFYNDYFYQISAQGGTSGPATSHMAVVARSRSEFGPFENSPSNPLIKTWSPYEKWRSKGHATLFEGPGGQWYALYHGYEDGNLPMGRKVLMEPVEWTKDGWVKSSIKEIAKAKTHYYTENVRPKNDDFASLKMDLQWSFSDYATSQNSALTDGALLLGCNSQKQSSLMIKMCDRDFDVQFRIVPDQGIDAGLVMLYNAGYYAGLKVKDGVVQGTYKNQIPFGEALHAPEAQYFKMRVRNYNLYLSYSEDGRNWIPYMGAFEISGYQCNVLGDFGALKIAVIGQGDGKILIDDFIYEATNKF